MGVGPDDTRDRPDEAQTEDVGLPEHERDESRRAGSGLADESAGLSDDLGADTGLGEPGLPEHEADARTATDTATGEQNP